MEDLQHLDDYRVFLNPVCSSSSTKGKTIDSWFYHLPVVTTPIGAEGLFYETIEPKFSGTTSVVAKSGFTNERETTKEE